MGEGSQAETVEGAITFSTPYFAAPSQRASPLLGEAELPPKPSRVEEPPPSRGRTLGEEDHEIGDPQITRRTHANDRAIDQERFKRHGGHPPPRRYHYSSWEGVLGPA